MPSKNYILLALFMGITYFAQAQTLYFARDGFIQFYSDAPLEEITATNEKVSTIFNPENGEVVIKVLIRSFHFEKALMQEHFNENYMESSTYPKATFKGKIVDYQGIPNKESPPQEVQVKGVLTIKGVDKTIQETGTIARKNNKLKMQTEFMIHLDDFNIKIPASVINNISKEIAITYRSGLEKMER